MFSTKLQIQCELAITRGDTWTKPDGTDSLLKGLSTESTKVGKPTFMRQQ